ncbi:MAG: metal-dependent transcriptional regulator [Chloroflexota bacterium]|nr:metal-dependent transcriptional regulator [Chloroflexota bacterium]
MADETLKANLGEPRPEVSAVAENYLQAIYKLSERGIQVFPTPLADTVGVSVATAVGMLRRLTRQGLVTVAQSKEISLTSKGRAVAEAVVRRHRLAERMLTELLGVDWHLAHEEAHRFEHAISPHVEQKLAAALGYPKTCPFGHPIPGYADATPSAVRLLSQVQEGETAVVERVPEEDHRLLEFFAQSGLKPGASLRVLEVAPFKGTITTLLDSRQVVLGLDVAARVMVRAPAQRKA